MKKAIVLCLSAVLTLGGTSSASAHAGFDTRGVTPVKGKSSVLLLRIGHGCTAPDGVTKVATHAVSAVIPAALLAAPASAAMQIPGWDAKVVASTEKDTAGSPVSNTITWTAKSPTFDVNPVGFAEFGIRGVWATAGTHFVDTIQVCRLATTTKVAGKVKIVTDPKTKARLKTWVAPSTKTTYQELKISWSEHVSSASTYNSDKTVETGPAPSVTIASA